MNKLGGKMLKEDYIILENLIYKYGEEAVINEMRLPKNILSRVAGAGLLAGSIAGLAGINNDDMKHQDTNIEQVAKKPSNPYGMSDNEYSLFMDRVDAVKQEIERILDIQNINYNELRFDPEYLVLLCHRYNYDIPLLIAQARQESQFGTTPRARRHNSLFSIGAWDNGKNKAKYDSQNEAIEDYINTMLDDYLDGGNITVDKLLIDGNFVNYNGHRYASDKKYERRLRSLRNSLINKYPCLSNDITPDSYEPDTKHI